MIFLGGFIFISVIALISIRWISAIDGFWKSVWWVASALSLFRIACLWIGYLSMKTEGVGQILGYFMVLCTLPEAFLARQIRGQPILWACMISLLIPIGSFLWIFLLGCLVAKKSKSGPLGGRGRV